jgi:hypothetical protein
MKNQKGRAKLTLAGISAMAILLVACASLTASIAPVSAAYEPGRVTAIFLKADDARPTGACPVTVTWRGYIKVNGPCRVQYTFTRSDGANAPVETIEFREAGTREVSTTWTLGGSKLPDYRGWQALKVVYPHVMESSHETGSFEIHCGTSEAFRVTSAVLKADSYENSGVCPVTVNFRGSITTNGAGLVKYVFTRNDGATSAVQYLTFDGAGTKLIDTSWRLGGTGLDAYRGWEAVRILAPNSFESSHETGAFAMRCAR